jgi:antitoxin HicB
MKARVNPHKGSDFESFLRDEGIYEEVNARALMRVAIEQLIAEMKRCKLNEAELARRMDTSRSQIHRLLSPECKSATVETLVRVADALGKRWKIQLVSGSPHRAHRRDVSVSGNVETLQRRAPLTKQG